MPDPRHNHIPFDETHRRRSKKLPSRRGDFISLEPQIAAADKLDRWNEYLADPQTMIVLDLFSGAGGMSHGFAEAGFFIAVGVDENPWTVRTHGYNFLSKSIQQDIRTIADPEAFIHDLGVPRVDLIIGGPPCQGYSLIGRGKLKSLGKEKEAYYRNVLNTLYQEFTRFVLALKPLAFVMENVPAMAYYDGGELVNRIKQSFPDYHAVDNRLLNAIHSGVPQNRQRLFIQGNRMGIPIQWPESTEVFDQPLTVAEAIGDLPPRDAGKFDEVLPYTLPAAPTAYQRHMREGMTGDNQKVVWDHITRQVRDDDRIIFEMMQQGDKYRDLPDEWKRYSQKGFDDKYWRLYEDRPSWTITAHIAKDAYRYIHPTQHRTLSVREFARLQSFPDCFRFAGPRTERLRQIGNAVPPMLAREIAAIIRKQILAWRETQPVEEREQAVGANVTG